MEKEKVISYILDELKSSPNHILNQRRDTRYFSDFMAAMASISAFLPNKKNLKHLCKTKLYIQKEFKMDKYLQGVSELLFWIYAVKKQYKFYTDKNVNNKNNTDVDIHVLHSNYAFNIEVKCPEKQESPDGCLGLILPYRLALTKEDTQNEVEKLKQMISSVLNTSNYSDIQEVKKDDNKIIDYLLSAQDKFGSSKALNTLVISVPSEKMQAIWGYLYNSQSGIFTEQLSKQFQKDGKPLTHDSFDKVDVVMLTNIISGHTEIVEDVNSWDLSKYCSIFFRNPYSKECNKKVKQLIIFCKLFPNDTKCFELERDNFIKNNTTLPVPDDLFFFHFIQKYYHIFWIK